MQVGWVKVQKKGNKVSEHRHEVGEGEDKSSPVRRVIHMHSSVSDADFMVSLRVIVCIISIFGHCTAD